MNANRENLLDQLTEWQRACVPTCTFELIPGSGQLAGLSAQTE